MFLTQRRQYASLHQRPSQQVKRTPRLRRIDDVHNQIHISRTSERASTGTDGFKSRTSQAENGSAHTRISKVKDPKYNIARNAKNASLTRSARYDILKGHSPFAATNQSHYTPAEARRSAQGKRDKSKRGDGYHALKMQKTLAEVSYSQRNRIKEQISEPIRFNEMGLLESIHEAIARDTLPGMTNVRATPIQRVAIPALLKTGRSNEREEFLLAAETGSGKTLAYLLPTLQGIKLAEGEERRAAEAQARSEQEFELLDPHAIKPPPVTSAARRAAARPKVIILLPTSELVSQVGAVVKSLSHKVKFRSAMISASCSPTVIRNRLFAPEGIDILLSTPRLLHNLTVAAPNILSRVSHLIIDEADTLFDKSFVIHTTTVIDRSAPSVQKMILCSATIPESLDNFLRKRFPSMKRLVTPHLHTIARRTPLSVVDIRGEPYFNNRLLACADTICNLGKEELDKNSMTDSKAQIKRILVFVNTREQTTEVANYLQKKGIDAVAMNRDEKEQRQSEILEGFTTRDATLEEPIEEPESAAVSNLVPQCVEAKAKVSQEGSSDPSDELPLQRDIPESTVRRLPNTKVIVATDIVARGIDTVAVKSVILYMVPKSTIDFIHRMGRVGRMGSRGRGIVLAGKDDHFEVISEIRRGMFQGKALI